LSGHDVDVETLRYGISGGTLSGDGLTVSRTGTYGTLKVTLATGAYVYTKNNVAIEALSTGQNPTDVFTVTVSDGDGSTVNQTYTVNLTGADDGPVRILPTDIQLTPVAPPDSVSFQTFAFSGTLTATDPDSGAISYAIVAQSDANLFVISGSTLSSGNLAPSKTYTVTIAATQVGDPASGNPETFTIVTGSNGNSGDTLNGSDGGDDVLYGNGNNQSEMLFGLAGNDTLFGMEGVDQLFGGDGSDVLNGGGGNDVLNGGASSDRFEFRTAFSIAGVDTTQDFNASATDKIVLDDAVFSAFAGQTVLTASQFVANAAGTAVGTGAQIIFNTTNGTLVYDANGTGNGGATQFATLTLLGSTGTLDLSDFLIV
jgi:VCBS repeat-containing protein